MKRLAIALLVLVLALVAAPRRSEAAIALVGAGAAAGGDNGGTTTGFDTTGATLLVAVVGSYNQTTQPTISDSKSNTWTALTAYEDGASRTRVRIYYVANPSVGAAHTATAAQASCFCSIAFAAFSGVTTTSPFDQQNGSFTDSGTSVQPGSITPSEDNTVVIAGLGSDTAASSHAINGSYTLQVSHDGGGAHLGSHLAFWIQTTATATNPTYSWSGTDQASAAIASFKSSGGAAPPKTCNPVFSLLGVFGC